MLTLLGSGATTGARGHVSTGCGLVRSIDDMQGAAAVVRSFRYTTLHASGCTIPVGCSPRFMDPICGTGAHECAEDECGSSGTLVVPFNSRSYLLADAAAAAECAEQPLGGDFMCVDVMRIWGSNPRLAAYRLTCYSRVRARCRD